MTFGLLTLMLHLSIVISATLYADVPGTRSVPRKTGNMSILSYRQPLLMDGTTPVHSLDPILQNPDALRSMGMTSVEDYITLDIVEPSKGEYDFTFHLANAEACRRLGLGYAIYPWVHFYPDWVEEEAGFTAYSNLEDGTTCRQPSGWAPYTRDLVKHYYTVLAKYLRQYVTAVYVTDCSGYGEYGYPMGYTNGCEKTTMQKSLGGVAISTPVRIFVHGCWSCTEPLMR